MSVSQLYIIKKIKLILLFAGLFLFTFPQLLNANDRTKSQKQQSRLFEYQKLVTPNPGKEAEAIFRYFQHTSGEKILSGQMFLEQGFNELEYIQRVTGKQPAILGAFLSKESVRDATKWWKEGGIPFMIWDWKAALPGNNLTNNKIDIEKCFQEGTVEYKWFWQELDSVASNLEKLRDAQVPVIWCPFHNPNDIFSWSGPQNPNQFKKLWQNIFHYFTQEHKLNNLIWAFNFSSEINTEWFPGNDYVDMIGASINELNNNPLPRIIDQISKLYNSDLTPLTFQLCKSMPLLDKDKKSNPEECFWIQYHTQNLATIDKNYLKEVYNQKENVTLDELPNFVDSYGYDAVKREWTSGTTLPFDELKVYDLGAKLNDVIFSHDSLEITSLGKGIKGKKDEACFVFKQLEGDFDVSVQVQNFQARHSNSMAGLMSRVDLSRNSPNIFFNIYSNNTTSENDKVKCKFLYRIKKSDKIMAINPDPVISDKYEVNPPNTWIRLKRRGNTFKSYISHNNTDWQLYSIHYQKMPDKLLVGIAVTSYSNQTTKAEFSDLVLTWE
ncbi:MAG TPA: glycosyl hydrolase [Draconibacterium sp.]|nr:glycosyl hydrolase [Draconibacterium sp.]